MLYLVMRANHWLESRLNKFSDPVDGSAIEIAAVFAVFDKLARRDVHFHLFARVKEIVFAVDLARPAGPRSI